MNRDYKIDFARGIAIILVVLGHCYSHENFITIGIYSFHMPFFFIVSGYCNKQFRGGGITKKISLCKKCLIAYYFFEVSYIVFLWILGSPVANVSERFIKCFIFYGNQTTWFLPAIFFVRVFFEILEPLKKFRFLVIACLVLPFLICKIENPSLIYIMFARIIIGMGFFTLGYTGARFIDMSVKVPIILIVFVIFIGLTQCNGMVSLFELDFGNNVFLYILNGILGSYLLLKFALFINKKDGIITYLGMNSIVILCTHKFVIEILIILDDKMFGGVIRNMDIIGGIVITIVTLFVEWLLIPLINQKMPWLLGRRKRS